MDTVPNSLTKNHIVEAIAVSSGFPRKKAAEIVETLLDLVKGSLESGEDVLVSGFGKFSVKEKQERRGRNPATGDAMMLKPRRVVTFKASGKLRDRLNGS